MKRISFPVVMMLMIGMLLGGLGSMLFTTVSQPQVVRAHEGNHGLLVNLTTDDTWSANMALSLAMNAREQGLEPVVVFLNVRGVYLADSGRMPAKEGNSEMNIHQKMQALIAAGGQVIACPGCSKEAGLTQEDYIEGVVMGEPGGIFTFLTDPYIAVMSY